MNTENEIRVPKGFHLENNEEPELVLDLVCGMQIKREDAKYIWLYEGKEYYFSGRNCKEHINNIPAMYAEV